MRQNIKKILMQKTTAAISVLKFRAYDLFVNP